MLVLVITYNYHLLPTFPNSNSPNIDLTSSVTFVYLYFLLMLSLTSFHDYHHVTLFALSKYLIVLFLHQVIVFSTMVGWKHKAHSFAFLFLLLQESCPLPFNVVFLASDTQIGLLLYETKIHHHLNIKTSRFKKGPNQDLRKFKCWLWIGSTTFCFLGCHP